MRKLKRIFLSIKNVIRWIPIIWKDYDWDHWFIYQVLKTKLKHQSQHLKLVGKITRSQRIDLCIKLLEKVQNEEYIDVALREREWTMESMERASKKHDKARKLLFKILQQNIEEWWS